MKPKRRIISFLLAICLVVGLMPTAAFAAGTDTGKAIQLGTSGISGYDSTNGYDYIYYGTWDSSAIKWRVLDDQTNTGGSGLFLLSDVLLGTGQYGGVYFQKEGHDGGNGKYYKGTDCEDNNHTDCIVVNVYQGSDAQIWCNGFYNDSFSPTEQAAVLAATKTDEEFTSSTYSIPFSASENILNGDKVFFLSAKESENAAYGFTDDTARVANYGESAGVWWLRSPSADVTRYAGAVNDNGYVDNINVYSDWAARPAFNLNLNSVLFTSAAAGGKSSGAVGADALKEIPDVTELDTATDEDKTNGNDWKLTLLDSERNFSVTETAAAGKPGDTITLKYTGASTGTNEYISIIIADNEGAKYYGRIAQPDSADGTVDVKIPADLAEGSYTLNVFSEKYNGGANDDTKLTDYASAFDTVTLTVCNSHSGGTANCKHPAICDNCGQPYGGINSSNHTGSTEVRNRVDATETAEGYTGDTYCLDCNMKIATGQTIPKKGDGSGTGESTGGGNISSDPSTSTGEQAVSDGDSRQTTGETNTKTGDDSNLLLWVIAAATAAMVGGGAAFGRKNKAD